MLAGISPLSGVTSEQAVDYKTSVQLKSREKAEPFKITVWVFMNEMNSSSVSITYSGHFRFYINTFSRRDDVVEYLSRGILNSITA